jgi:leucyl aminopeptidase (aminopeptidase T)
MFYGDDAVTALAKCPSRQWLTWLASALMRRGHLDRRVIVLCACASARTALKYVPTGELRPLRAIETAEAWCRGEATIDDVRAARNAADAAYAAANAAYAAANAAYAAAAAADAYAAAAAADADAAAAAAAADAAYADAYADAADADEADQLALTKWMLGPAILDGLRAYAETPGGAL